MTLIIVKNKNALDITSLKRYVLRSVYEPEKMSAQEMRLMQESIINWSQHLKLKREIGFSAVEEEVQIALEEMADLIKRNDNGELEKRKELFREKNIDWRKFHRLPDAYNLEDFARAEYYHSLLPKEEQ